MASSLIDNYLRVPAVKEGDFFRLWVEFLRPYHEMTQREAELLTCLLKARHQLSKDIANEEILEQTVFSHLIRDKICDELGLTWRNYNVLICRLKAKRMIIDGKINKRFIPSLKEDAKEFKMVICFDFSSVK